MSAQFTAALIGLIAPAGATVGYLVRRWLATERPFLATIEHQDDQIRAMRLELHAERTYVRLLVSALRDAGLDVPLPPPFTESPQ